MPSPNSDPSIENEPHLQGGTYRSDPSEESAKHFEGQTIRHHVDDQVEHTVWDEPGLSPQLSGEPPDYALTYERWLEERRAETSVLLSLSATFWAAILAGPLAVLGTLISGDGNLGLILVTIVGPTTEEMMKIAIPLWIVEKRPFLFKSQLQIMICAIASGLVFAAIENVMYLVVMIPNAGLGLWVWRWTVCVAMHAGCSFIASQGLCNIWSRTMTEKTRPELSLGARFLVMAIVVHGSYNLFAVLLETSGFEF